MVLPLCREAVSVFCRFSRLGQKTQRTTTEAIGWPKSEHKTTIANSRAKLCEFRQIIDKYLNLAREQKKNTVKDDDDINWSCFLNGPQSAWATPSNECLGYNIKTSDGEARILKIWGMWSSTSLPLLPGPLRLGVVVPVRIQSMGQIKLFKHSTLYKQMTDVKLNCYVIAILETIKLCANK